MVTVRLDTIGLHLSCISVAIFSGKAINDATFIFPSRLYHSYNFVRAIFAFFRNNAVSKVRPIEAAEKPGEIGNIEPSVRIKFVQSFLATKMIRGKLTTLDSSCSTDAKYQCALAASQSLSKRWLELLDNCLSIVSTFYNPA